MGESAPDQAQSAPIPASAFDPSSVEREIQVIALRLRPQHIQSAVKDLRKHLLNKARQPNVIEAPAAAGESGVQAVGKGKPEKLVMLSESITAETIDDLPEPIKAFALRTECTLVRHTLPLTYTSFTYEEVMQSYLPKGIDVPTSFETIGHVAHLNLRENQLPHRLIIARVMREKNSSIKTVVTKVGTIQNTFRVFSMEVLADDVGGKIPRIAEASDAALETSVKQHGCTFKMNFGEVYWNSRLEAEHRRLVESFADGDVLWDMFAGIGPFAVPAARSGKVSTPIFANDLNPRSTHYLAENCKANKVDGKVEVTTLCAREFLRRRVVECGSAAPDGHVHCVMNLPANSPEFTDVFKGAFEEGVWKGKLPTVHLYAFSKNADPEVCAKDIAERIGEHLGVVPPGWTWHEVRDVAPKKLMMCITFALPEAQCLKSGALGELRGMLAAVDGGDAEREAKRAKTDS